MTTSRHHLLARGRRTAGLAVATALLTGLTGCGAAGSAVQEVVGRNPRGEFCDRLEQALPTFRPDPRPLLGPDAGASEWQAWFDLAHARNARLVAAAPAGLGSPLGELQAVTDRLAAFYAEAEYDPNKVDAGARAQLLADGRYEQARATVAAYARSTCRIDTQG